MMQNGSSATLSRGGTLNQAQRLQAFFEAYDADDDGFLSRTELEELFVSLRLPVTPPQLDDIFASLQLPPTQPVDLTNFSRIYIRVKRLALTTPAQPTQWDSPQGQDAMPMQRVPAGRGTSDAGFAGLPHVAMTSSTFLESQQQLQQQRSFVQSTEVQTGRPLSFHQGAFATQPPRTGELAMASLSASTPNFMEGIPLQNLNSNIRKSAVISPDEVIDNVPRQLIDGGSEENSRQELIKSKIVKTYSSDESGGNHSPSAPFDVDTIEDYYFYSDDEPEEEEEEAKDAAAGGFRRRALSGIKESADMLEEPAKAEPTPLFTLAEEPSKAKMAASPGRRKYMYNTDRRDSEASLLIKEKTEQRRKKQELVTESPKSRQGRRYQQVAGASPNAAGYVALKDPYVRKQLKVLYYSEPYFLCLLLLLQAAYLALTIYRNGGFELLTVNPFAGANQYTMLGYGALWAPCMRATPGVSPYPVYQCNPHYSGYRAANGSCTYYDNVFNLCAPVTGDMALYPNKLAPSQWYRMFSSMVMTNGVADYFVNFFVLWRMGFPLEKSIGWWRMMLLFIGSGICATMAQTIFDGTTVTGMAMSVSYCTIGFSIVDLYSNYHLLFKYKQSQIRLWIIFVIAMTIGLLPMVPNFANLGALFGGALGGATLQRPIAFNDDDLKRKRYIKYGAALLFITGIVVGIALFYTGADASNCTWCKWLDCVPADSDWCGTKLQ